MAQPNTATTLCGSPVSDCESIGENDDPHPWEAYDAAYDQYLEDLVFLHMDHMCQYNKGNVTTEQFWSDGVDDVYSNHMYAISWFYNGCCDLDGWEAGHEALLYALWCDVTLEHGLCDET